MKPRTKVHAFNDVLDMLYDMENHAGFFPLFPNKRQ